MLFVYCIAIAFAAELYVSPRGTDTVSAGTQNQPFQTISFALEQIQNGDKIWLFEGKYEVENLLVDNLNRVTISALPGHEVVLDGTRQITSTWTRLSEDNRIWTTSPSFPIWQLFLDGAMVGLARFPNAPAWSESSWDRFQWREQAPGSSNGIMKDLTKDCDSQTLAGLGRSLNGCVATLNVGHWVSVSSVISNHESGSDTFNYVNDRNWWFDDGHYMVECLAALDAPGEWGYDWETNTLYLWPEDEVDPNDVEIRGKTNDYLMFVSNAERFEISNMKFFGGGLKFNNVIKSTVENVVFDHPSFNMRALGRAHRAPSALLISRSFQDRNTPSRNIIRGCTFQYTDGAALEIIRGYGDSIDHNTFYAIDYSAAYATGAIDFLSSQYTKFRWNSVDTTGSSETVRVGPRSTIKYNIFKNGGLLQEDGAAVQVPVVSQEGTLIYRNWAIDNGKLAFRFDTPHMNGDMGRDGEMIQNVAFNNRRGLSVKADNHLIEDNTAVMNSWYGANDLIVYVDNLGQAQWQYNTETITRGNLAGTISGTSKGQTDLNNPGDNFATSLAVNLLRDPLHGDFRPKARSEYGAYKFPRQRNYWIPGPQHLTKATTPLPANEAMNVPSDVDLKWQVCREGCMYDVYFGSDRNDLELVAGQIDHNVVRLSRDLEVGLTYYWRVDTQHGIGEVWEFTVGPDFVYDPSNACVDLDEIVSEIDEIRIALNQDRNGWKDWCQSERVENAFEQTSFLKNYDLSDCTDAKCGRERMQNPVCDLEFVASSVMGRSPWLGVIASDLNQPHCFGGVCSVDNTETTEETFSMPSGDMTWTQCNFPMLYADVNNLYSIISLKSAWDKDVACAHEDVEQIYRSSSILPESTCSDVEVETAAQLILNSWFGSLVTDVRDCYSSN